MAHIKIDYDGLAQQSAALKNYAATYESLCSRMKNMSDQISSTWEGAASDAFAQIMEQYRQQGKAITEIIQTIQGYADMTSNSFQSVDRECANLIRNSF
ncbi:MAG: WXG100 family type VII secretion target [Oliverpabstia sp.]